MTPRNLESSTASKMGRAGARNRAKALTPARRKQIARAAARARWGKKKDK